MPTLQLLFEGLCCHIEPPANVSLPGVRRRAVLQNLNHQPKHICYIECYTTNFDTAPNPGWTPIPYWRNGQPFVRFEIEATGVKIAVANALPTPFEVLQSFKDTIPSLQAVNPSFEYVKDDFLRPKIQPNDVAAYVDITAGKLSAGPVESFQTTFDPQFLWTPRHLGQWAQLELQIDGAAPVLLVTDLTNDTPRPLVFKPGTTVITIGNQTENDILGVPPQPGDEGHFDAFYDLAISVTSRPKPKGEGLGLGTGCTNSSWP